MLGSSTAVGRGGSTPPERPSLYPLMPSQFFFWCQRCGSIRVPFEELWRIPLTQTGDVTRASTSADDTPTQPDLNTDDLDD